MRRYYGIDWKWNIHKFSSRAARDAWVLVTNTEIPEEEGWVVRPVSAKEARQIKGDIISILPWQEKKYMEEAKKLVLRAEARKESKPMVETN